MSEKDGEKYNHSNPEAVQPPERQVSNVGYLYVEIEKDGKQKKERVKIVREDTFYLRVKVFEPYESGDMLIEIDGGDQILLSKEQVAGFKRANTDLKELVGKKEVKIPFALSKMADNGQTVLLQPTHLETPPDHDFMNRYLKHDLEIDVEDVEGSIVLPLSAYFETLHSEPRE